VSHGRRPVARAHASTTVRAMLLAKIDDLVVTVATLLAQIRTATEQLEPERARSCRNAIHDGVGDGRRDPATGPRPPARPTRTLNP
jgi:hypothetical protein